MKRTAIISLLSLLLSAPASVFATTQVSTNFLEAGRANIYFNGQEPSADGYYISGRKLLTQHVYLVGDYYNTRIDGFDYFSSVDGAGRVFTSRLSINDDFKEFSIGLGYLFYVSEHSFVSFEARHYELEQETRSDFSITYSNPLEIEREIATDTFDDSGSIFEIGFTSRPLAKFEFEAGLGYRNVSATRGVYADLSASYLINDDWKVRLSTEQGDTDRVMLGVAYVF